MNMDGLGVALCRLDEDTSVRADRCLVHSEVRNTEFRNNGGLVGKDPCIASTSWSNKEEA